MMPTRLIPPLALLLAIATPAAADTVLRLAETATIAVPPDELACSLRAVAVTATPAQAQARVNAMMEDAVARARKLPGLVVATGGYEVWRDFQGPSDKGGKWQASQSLELKGRDGAALLKLVGELQASGLAVGGLTWQLAAETARRARAEATEQAIRGLRGRAEDAAALLDLRFDSFREVRLDSVRPAVPRAMMAAAPMAMAAAPPSAEPEDVQVSATAEADVLLKPR